ncbi:MAG: PKD domain-containing protein [Bacteroidota bacterium]
MRLIIRSLLFIVFTISTASLAWGQVACPTATAGPDTTVCSGSCVTLTATSNNNIAATTTYTGSNIPYNPFSYAGPNIVSIPFDDKFSSVIDLPFTFCFFGQSHTQCVIGSNGTICFDLTLANANSSFTVSGPIPANNNNSTINSIMGAYYDMFPIQGGTINTAVYGTAPCRQFVVSFNQVPMYSCTNLIGTQQIVLYETTNTIDINIASKPACNAWQGNRAIVGIEDATGVTAFTAPGKNGVSWTATNFGYRFTPSGAAATITYSWTNQSTGANVGSGSSITVCPVATTTYVATASFNTGCNTVTATDPATVTIGGNSLFAAFTDVIHYGCSGDTVIFTNSSTGTPTVTWWSFGDGQFSNATAPTHIYATPGIYTIKLGLTSGNCHDTVVHTINTLAPAGYNASYTYTLHQHCTGDTVFFTNTSTLASTYSWNFGDGGTDTAANPYHFYPTPGNYTVTLYSFDANCRRDTAIQVVSIVHIQPVASFTVSPDTVCLGQPNLFTSTSVGTNLSSAWTYGDGNTGAGPVSVNTYAAAGTYSTKLVITDGIGCMDSTAKNVYVVTIPTSSFTDIIHYGCSGDTVEFNNTSTGNPLVTWWSFGDGQFSNLLNPNHIYSLPGIYTIKLGSISGACADTTTQTINTLPPAGFNAAFTYYIHHHCSGDSVFFTNTSTLAVRYLWNLGDGTTDTSTNPVHFYPNQGNYTITLYIFNVNCRKDTAIQTITLTHAALAASFTSSADTACVGQTVSFNNTSTGAGLSYAWSFGDGGTSTLASPTHLYNTTTGTFTVKLVITDSIGCKDSTSKNLVIGFKPTVNAGPDVTTCIHDSIQLQVTYTPAGNYTITWTNQYINDNTIADPSVSPPNTFDYVVSVTNALTGTVCAGKDTVRVNVLQGYTISTPDTTICQGKSVQVIATGDPNYTYLWTPPIGVSSVNIINPIITPDTSRTYSIIATYPGCHDSIKHLHINVQPSPHIYVPPTRGICEGDTIHVHAFVSPTWYTQYTYNWTPTGVLAGTNFNTPDVVFVGNIDTTIVVTAVTTVGCADTDSVHLTVYSFFDHVVSPPGGKASVCPGTTIPLELAGSGITFEWTPTIYLSDSTIANPTSLPVTSTTYTVRTTDIHGCHDTLRIELYVYPSGIINLPDSVVLYPGETAMLHPEGNCMYYTWSPATYLSSGNISDPIAAPPFNMLYHVSGTTENGCIASDSEYVIVHSGSIVDVPNVFTPGTGSNGKLNIVVKGMAVLKDFSIFNRWGNKVFETDDINEGWNGDYKGEPQPMGVYVYMIEGFTSNGVRFYKQGNVTLIR